MPTDDDARLLLTHLRARVSLSDDEGAAVAAYFSTRAVRSRETLVREGERQRELYFVTEGCLRLRRRDEAGRDRTALLCPRDWWAIDVVSVTHARASRFDVEAVLPSRVVAISRERFFTLLEAHPRLEKWLRMLLSNAIAAAEDRLVARGRLSAVERLAAFDARYPELATRLSQRVIASYIDVSPEHLSGLRRQGGT